MPEPKERHLHVFEVAQGELALKLQHVFVEAQKLAAKYKDAVTVTCQLKIHAPDNDGQFSGIEFSVHHTVPKDKSVKYTTRINSEGVIVAEGRCRDDILQTVLDLSYPELNQCEKFAVVGGKAE